MNIFVIMILFCVSVLWFALLTLLRLPHLRVGVYNFNSPWLHRFWIARVYPLILMLAAVCWTILLILYIIYVIIRTFVPWPLKKPLLNLSVFKALRETGIVALLDSIFGIIFSRSSFLERLKRAGHAVGTFFIGYTLFIIGRRGKEPWKTSSSPVKKESNASLPKDSRKPPPPEPVFEPSMQRKVDEELAQCLEENTAHATQDMTPTDIRILEGKNTISRTMCKLRNMQSAMNVALGNV